MNKACTKNKNNSFPYISLMWYSRWLVFLPLLCSTISMTTSSPTGPTPAASSPLLVTVCLRPSPLAVPSPGTFFPQVSSRLAPSCESLCSDFLLREVVFLTTLFKSPSLGTSLVVRWLRRHTPNAGGSGSTPGQETRSCIPQLKVCMPQLKDPVSCN